LSIARLDALSAQPWRYETDHRPAPNALGGSDKRAVVHAVALTVCKSALN
jgi:hypothetical protein